MGGSTALLALSVAAGSSPLGPLQTDSLTGTVVVGVFFLFGLYLSYTGFRKWQRKRLMQDTATEKVRSAAAGRTELTGTCEPIEAGGTIPRPFTAGECLVAVYEIEEWDDSGDDDHWRTLDSGTLVTPFYVDDGTGRMRVEPDPDATYEISDANADEIRVDDGRLPPEEIVAFLEETPEEEADVGPLAELVGDRPSVRGDDDRRYTQRVLPPGERIYLLGGTSPGPDTAAGDVSTLVFGRDEGSGEFVIADQSEDELVSEYTWEAPAQIAGGIALSAVMLYLLLA